MSRYSHSGPDDWESRPMLVDEDAYDGGKTKGRRGGGGDRGTFFPTFFVGVMLMLIAATGVAGLLNFYGTFIAAGTGLGLVVVGPCILPALMSGCVYGRENNSTRTKRALRTVMLCAIWWGVVAGAAGGYFLREWYTAHRGVNYTDIEATDGPHTDLGRVTFSSGGPQTALAGRASGLFGLVPTCVVPVLGSAADRSVAYWGVDHGPCCGKEPITCKSFASGKGGIVLEHSELYPNTGDAIEKAVAAHGLTAQPGAQLLLWGNPDDKMKEVMVQGATVAGGAGLLGLLAVFYKSTGI